METICLQCGVKGFEELLISCDKCRTYAVHPYCLDVIPIPVDEYVVWLCCDCEPNSVESSTTDEGPSHPDGENNSESLIQTLEKKQNRARIGGKKSATKTAVCSQTNSDLLKPSNISSLQIFEVKCSENDKKDPEFGRQDELQREDFDELVEPLGTEDLALAIPDLHPTEADSFYTDDDHPKPEQQNGVDVDGFREVFGSLETEKPLVPTHGLQLIVPIGCEDIDNNQNRLHEFKFCQEEESLKTKEPQLATDIAEQSLFILAQPVKDPIWRGSISIFKRDYGTSCGLVAHLSSIACLKVREEAKALPTLLSTELLPRLDIWPKGFSKFWPRDDCIALYFFPDNGRHEKVFDRLVDDMISRDLALKVVVENAELLIFSSDILPMSYWRIQDKFYLWGVFRGKHPSAVAVDVLPREQSFTKFTTWDNSSRDGPVSSVTKEESLSSNLCSTEDASVKIAAISREKEIVLEEKFSIPPQVVSSEQSKQQSKRKKYEEVGLMQGSIRGMQEGWFTGKQRDFESKRGRLHWTKKRAFVTGRCSHWDQSNVPTKSMQRRFGGKNGRFQRRRRRAPVNRH